MKSKTKQNKTIPQSIQQNKHRTGHAINWTNINKTKQNKAKSKQQHKTYQNREHTIKEQHN